MDSQTVQLGTNEKSETYHIQLQGLNKKDFKVLGRATKSPSGKISFTPYQYSLISWATYVSFGFKLLSEIAQKNQNEKLSRDLIRLNKLHGSQCWSLKKQPGSKLPANFRSCQVAEELNQPLRVRTYHLVRWVMWTKGKKFVSFQSSEKRDKKELSDHDRKMIRWHKLYSYGE